MDIVALKAMVFVVVTLAVATVLRPRLPEDTVSGRIIAYWIGGAVIAFGSPVDSIKLLGLMAYMAALTPPRHEDRAAFFLCSVLALPMHVFWWVPFPGINVLLRLDHAVIASIVLALPLIFAQTTRRVTPSRPVQMKGTPFADTFFVLLFILIALLNARDTTFTNSVRSIVNDAFIWLLPYFALTRGLASVGAIRSMTRGALTIGVLMTFLAMLTIAQSWNHYDLAGNSAGFANTAVRNGGVRVNLTVMHTLAGVLLAAAFASFWFAARRATALRVMAFPLLFFSVLGVFGTQSRGAVLAAVIMLVCIMVLRVKSNAIRWGLSLAGATAMLVLIMVVRSAGFDTVDAHGTFAYRDQLLTAGLSYIPIHPWFGSTNYSDAEHFAHLIQGQGIIDFVNGYLQWALRWGLVGMTMLIACCAYTMATALRAIYRIRRQGEAYADVAAFGMGYLAFFVALFVSLATTSDISYYPTLLAACLGIGQAMRKVSYAVASAPIPSDTAPQSVAVRSAPYDMPFDLTPGPKGAWS